MYNTAGLIVLDELSSTDREKFLTLKEPHEIQEFFKTHNWHGYKIQEIIIDQTKTPMSKRIIPSENPNVTRMTTPYLIESETNE